VAQLLHNNPALTVRRGATVCSSATRLSSTVFAQVSAPAECSKVEQ
jgi:hypothetical protein